MKDGYYLSTYIAISDYSHISNISIRHDQNISLWRKNGNEVELVRYWELERFTGLKHQFPAFYNFEHAIEVIQQLLMEEGITFDDIQQMWGTPILEKNTGVIHSKVPDNRFSYHSYAHLFSGLMIDTDIFNHETILALALDGGPDALYDNGMLENNAYIASISSCGKIMEYISVSSPALLWNYFRNQYGMEEGTLMALGSASSSKLLYYPSFPSMQIRNYKEYLVMQSYFQKLITYINGLTEKDAGVLFNYWDNRFTIEENKISMCTKILNEYSYQLVNNEINDILKKYKLKKSDVFLSLTGGFALNCPTNTMLMKGFKKQLLSPPCVSDTGMSLGIALFEFFMRYGNFNFVLPHCYYGKIEISDEKTCLNYIDRKFSPFIKSIKKVDYDQIVDDILKSPVVWFYGAAEMGPRALGHRSLLGNPKLESTKNWLNTIKKRQWWRPVAPIVLEEYVEDFFKDSFPTQYMLNTFYIKEDQKSFVPAILHLDDSARVQTINRNQEPIIYELIQAFYKHTGVPMLCNTSLNDKGEPIINTANQALHFALVKHIEIVYINGYRVELHMFDNFLSTIWAKREINFYKFADEEERLNLLNEFIRSYEFTEKELKIYCKYPNYFGNLDIHNETDRKKIKRYIRVLNVIFPEI